MIITVFHMADACDSDHLVILEAVSSCKISVRKDIFPGKSFSYVRRIDERDKAITVILINIIIGIVKEPFMIREPDTFLGLVRIFGITSETDAFIIIKINIINAAVI